jgi:hypothetical protein
MFSANGDKFSAGLVFDKMLEIPTSVPSKANESHWYGCVQWLLLWWFTLGMTREFV